MASRNYENTLFLQEYPDCYSILHKKCPRYSGGIHIEQMLAYYYSAAFSSVAGASALSVASVFFFALPERRVFLAAAFASPLPLP